MSRSTAAGLGYFVVLLAVAGTTSDPGPFVIAELVICAAALSGTVALLLRRGDAVTSVPPILQGLAYFPQATDALVWGLEDQLMYVPAPSVQQALLTSTAFVCLGSLGAHVLSRTPPVRALGGLITRLAAPHGESLFAPALAVTMLITTAVTFQAGAWSNYLAASDSQELTLGGIQLEQTYVMFLAVCFAYVSARISATLIGRLSGEQTSYQARLTLWWLALAVLTALVFMLQMRRALVSTVVMALTVANAQLIIAPARQWSRPILLAVTAASMLVIGAFVMSTYWRSSLRYDSESTVVGRVSTTIEYAQSGEADATDMAEEHARRFTYLWMEAAALQYFGGRDTAWSISDVLLHRFINAVPGLLVPNKYAYEPLDCESAFELMGVLQDLPCTASAEGVIFGGVIGVLTTLGLWALGLALGQAICGAGRPLGVAVAAAMASFYFRIETGAFPVVQAGRSLAILILATGGLSLALKLLFGVRRS